MDDWVDITLRLIPGSDVPRGEIVVLGIARRFHGWLELLRQLEQARGEGCLRAGTSCDTPAAGPDAV